MNTEAPHSARPATFGPHELAVMFFRHKKKALAFALGVVALATLVILYAPRKYRSEARLFLQVGRESVRLDPTATTGDTIALHQSGRDNEVATTIEVLKSRSIVEKAVDELTPAVVLGEGGDAGTAEPTIGDTILAPIHYALGAVKQIDPISKREEAVLQVMDNLEVYAEFDSTVIIVTYDAETPRLAQDVTAAVVDVFRDEHVRLHRTSGSKRFFAEQRNDLERQLVEAQNKLREAKNRMGVTSVEARRESIELRLSNLELTRNSTIQQLSAAQARTAALEAEIEGLPERLHTSTRTMPNTGADALRSQLYGLQVQLMNLEAKYQPDHPLVVSTRAQVDEAQQMIADEEPQRSETVDSLNANHQSLSLELAKAESELAGFEAQLAELDEQQAAALADLKKLNHYEVELEELQRSVQLASTNFYNYAEALEQARIDEELDRQSISNINLAQRATLAEKPISPSKLLVGALSLVLLTSGTLALVLGCEKFDSRLRTREQVEQALELPVFATVPEGRMFGAMPGRLASPFKTGG
ncbi:MAG TPA: Wzz/FepE/Etk N-terminal domain-containing protein [Lacipirellula sp.]